MSLDDHSNLLRRALGGKNWGSCGYVVANVTGTAPDDHFVQPPRQYFRFWHGYQVLTRPILAVAGVAGIRIAGLALLFAGLLVLGLGVTRLVGLTAAVVLTAPLVLLTNFTELPYSFPHALDVSLALASCGALCLLVPRIRGDFWWLAAAGLALGAVFNFFTFLLTPALALALVMFVAPVWSWVIGGRGWRLSALMRGLVVGAAWLFGYGGTFVSKWVLASAVFGWRPVWNDAHQTVSHRLYGGDTGGPSYPVLGALRLNLAEYGHSTELIVLAVALALIAFVYIRRGGAALIDLAVLAAPALIPFIWLFLLREHSNAHYWFTYRSLAISFGIVYAAAFIADRTRPAQPAAGE
jgi:hypothetical protein